MNTRDLGFLPSCSICGALIEGEIRMTWLANHLGCAHSVHVVCSERCARRDERQRATADVEYHSPATSEGDRA